MFQKFHTDTMGSRFIKSLLSQTPIPLFDSVVDGDHLVSGRYYVYTNLIIKCVSSGIISLNSTDKQLLKPSETLYPSIYLFPGSGYRGATFYVIAYVDDYNPKTFSVFKSSNNYYDSETHKYLSKYLRFLYTSKGINLFPYYNCYSSIYFDDVCLQTKEYNKVVLYGKRNPEVKVVGIPILFGHSYSISIDCPTEVLMRACFHDDSGFTQEDSLIDYETEHSNDNVTTLHDTLSSSGKVYSSLKFSSPVTFRLETSSKAAMMLQNNLYLLIQLPVNNDSSIVVLENYTNTKGVSCNEKHVRNIGVINPSLLRMNTHESYAFSDRLLEYLLGNIITANDVYSKNIETIQTQLSNLFEDYKNMFISRKYVKGVWDNDIPRFVTSLIEEQPDKFTMYDHDGNINKDIESLLYQKGDKF